MKRIQRSQKYRILFGVCGGFADYFVLDPALVRLVWIFFTLFGGSGILAYILALIMIQNESYVYTKSSELEKKSEGSLLFWKVLLVMVGIILFFQYRELFGMILDSFWGSGINVVFSLLLIGMGVYLLYFRRGVKPSILEGDVRNSLHLSTTEKKIFGLCGGIAKSLQIDVVIIRFLWIFGTFLSAGTGILLYMLLSFILPKPSTMSKESV
ncbi:MAG TPA: hypothetical protein DIS65_00080 [Candidatus Marinimicrobia bacterium]|nr:hypothetical protein [Candidatus Neomarinimicrobiota bacterium]|tara:strand:+ start:3255 stop:3887 length:633 start_codon:yes stop_codon:yes gene_type:complete